MRVLVYSNLCSLAIDYISWYLSYRTISFCVTSWWCEDKKYIHVVQVYVRQGRIVSN